VSEMTATACRDLLSASDFGAARRLDRLCWWNLVVGLVLAAVAPTTLGRVLMSSVDWSSMP